MEEKKLKETLKKPEPKDKASETKKKREREDFKKKYFEYYDDIKISDRQDW